MAVHAGHLKFVFEVGNSPQPADDHPAIYFTHKVLKKAPEAFYGDVRIMAENFSCDFNAFVDGEERPFVGAVRHADHHLIEQAGSTADQIFVATGEGIKSSWVDGCNHAFLAVPMASGARRSGVR